MALALLAVTTACLAPYILSLYHVEAGGRIVSAAEAGDQAAQARLPQAVDHFQSALGWEADNAHAYRLLGRAHLAAGDPGAAIPPLTRFTLLRPDHPLGYWELALTHERIWREWADLIYYDLVIESPLAQVEAPERPTGSPLCGADDPSEECYVAVGTREVAGRDESVLFQRSPSRVTYQLDLPPQPAVLRLRPGLAPVSGDGVGLSVLIRAADGGSEERLYGTLITPDVALGEEARLDLGRYVGRSIFLTLAADPGPEKEDGETWAMWGVPSVEDVSAAQLEPAGRAARAAMVQAWEEGGFDAEDFLDAGEAARKAGQYEEALAWYGRAMEMGSELGSSPWYFRFLALRDQGDEARAYDALRRAIVADRGWRDPEIRFRAWHYWGVWLNGQRHHAEAGKALLNAIVLYPQGSEARLQPLLSQTYVYLGLTQRSQGNLDQAVGSLETAVQLNERSPWAHISYGKSLYLQDPGRAFETEREFAIALSLSTHNPQIWKNLISFWRQQGELEKAESLCQEAKQIKEMVLELEEACPSR